MFYTAIYIYMDFLRNNKHYFSSKSLMYIKYFQGIKSQFWDSITPLIFVLAYIFKDMSHIFLGGVRVAYLEGTRY